MATSPKNDIFSEANVIFEYTRAQAIADGVLVDLSTTFPTDTRMFNYPLACTAAVWELIESAAAAEETDPSLYVWDTAYMAYHAIRTVKNSGSPEMFFKVTMPLTENGTEHKLKLVCGPGDDGEATLTIMLPEED